MSTVSETLKKLKNSEDNKEVLHNYSSILSSCFCLENNSLKSFLYSFSKFPEFGLLLPIPFKACPFLSFQTVFFIDLDWQSKLRRFQHELWSDLLKSAKDPIGRVSEANYFVVPLANGIINWEVIRKALGEIPLPKLKDFNKGTRQSLVLKTSFRGQVLWKYLNELDSQTSVSGFFEFLFAGDFGKSKENTEKFVGFDPLDIIFNENFSNPATKDLRNLLITGLISEFDENSILIFAKQLKSLRTHDSEVVNKNTKGVPILPIDLFEVFYLDFFQWEQAKGVLNTLIEIEEFSWVLEFTEKFELEGDLQMFKAACNCYSPETRKIFENFQVLGGVVCRFVIGLWVYLEEFQNFEGKCVEKVEKDLLQLEKCGKICKNAELFMYLKTTNLKAVNFRPAFYASKETITEAYHLEHKVSEILAAGLIRSLTGAILFSNGLKSSVQFLLKLKILQESAYSLIEPFLNNDNLFIINGKISLSPATIPKFSEIFSTLQKNSLETLLDYEFVQKQTIQKAQTLELFNSRLVKTLAKSIIDLILAYNLLISPNIDTALYLYLLNELRHSFNITRITLASELFKYFEGDQDKKNQIQKVFTEMHWDEHLFKTQHPNTLPVLLETLFYNVTVAVLQDCQNVSILFFVIGFFFADVLQVCLKHKKRIKKILAGKVSEMIRASGVKVDYREVENQTGATVKAFISKDLISETTAKSLNLARLESLLNVYKFICMCNLVHHNSPFLIVD